MIHIFFLVTVRLFMISFASGLLYMKQVTGGFPSSFPSLLNVVLVMSLTQRCDVCR